MQATPRARGLNYSPNCMAGFKRFNHSDLLFLCLIICLSFVSTACDSGKNGIEPDQLPASLYNGYTAPASPAQMGGPALGEFLHLVWGEALGAVGTPASGSNGTSVVGDRNDCPEGGRLNVRGNLSDQGIGKLAIEFLDCNTDGLEVSGYAEYQIYAFDLDYLVATVSSFSFDRLQVKSDTEQFLLSGSVRFEIPYTSEEISTFNLEILDISNDREYRFSNYIVTTSERPFPNLYESHQGSLFIDKLGRVDVSTEQPIKYLHSGDTRPLEGVVRLTGADQAFVIYDFSTHEAIVDDGPGERTHYLIDNEIANPLDIDLTDQDGDGIHDSAEIFYGLSLTEDDSQGNLNGNLFTNIEEYRRRSNLLDPDTPKTPAVKLTYLTQFWDDEFLVRSTDGNHVVAMSPGDKRFFSIALLDAYVVEESELRLEELEKLRIEILLPKGFHLASLRSDFGECSKETRSCKMHSTIQRRDFHRIAFAELVADQEAKQGEHHVQVEFQGFLEHIAPPVTVDNTVVLGTRIDYVEEQLNMRVGSEHVNRVSLEPGVYWGSFDVYRVASELTGNLGNDRSTLYLTSALNISAVHFTMSGFDIIGRNSNIHIADRSADSYRQEIEPKVHLFGNNYHSVPIICGQGNPIISESRFYEDSGVYDYLGCESLIFYNNVFEEGREGRSTVGLSYADLTAFNNTFLRGILTLYRFRDAAPNHIIKNNVFVSDPGNLVMEFLNDEGSYTLENNVFFGGSKVHSNGQEVEVVGRWSNIKVAVPAEIDELRQAPKPGSPLIDAGSSTLFPIQDIMGRMRPMDGSGDGSRLPDVGAFEYQP